MEELHSKICDECNILNKSYKIFYQCLHKDVNNDFFYDEEKKKHCHKDSTVIYHCCCSNGHKWNEYAIYRCNSCNWQSSNNFKKIYKSNEIDEYRHEYKDDDLSYIGLYIMTLIFTYF